VHPSTKTVSNRWIVALCVSAANDGIAASLLPPRQTRPHSSNTVQNSVTQWQGMPYWTPTVLLRTEANLTRKSAQNEFIESTRAMESLREPTTYSWACMLHGCRRTWRNASLHEK
jgi:hypothetical protein